jgi:predicted CXXCH cytochrome family protein
VRNVNAEAGPRGLQAVMHGSHIQRSCKGCHENRQRTLPACASCHTSKTRKENSACSSCHTPPAGVAPGDEGAPKPRNTLALGAIPEQVSIGALAHEREPSPMPHGRIVRALEQGIAGTSPSWSALHADKRTLCASCHHHAPAEGKTPACVSCHPKSGPAPADGRPLLQAAYHQQCMGCHQRMRLQKPADVECEACHARRVPTAKQ